MIFLGNPHHLELVSSPKNRPAMSLCSLLWIALLFGSDLACGGGGEKRVYEWDEFGYVLYCPCMGGCYNNF